MMPFMPPPRLIVLLGLAGLLGLGGCVSAPPSHFYQLQPGTAELPSDDEGVAILLGPLTLADYLQRETLVQRQADGSLRIQGDLRWAGSLEDDVARVLLRQLAGRLDTSRVALYPDRVGLDPDLQVLLNVVRFDAGPSQPAVLEAQWRLLDGAGKLRDSDLVRLEQAHDGTVAGQVQAQSALLQVLGERLAEAMRPLDARRGGAERAQTRRKPAAPGARQEAPARSGAEPVRTEMEVFRF